MNRPYKPVAPVAVSVTPLSGAATPPANPWGAQPICAGCNRGATYSCICDPFFDEGEPDYEAEHRVAESLRQIDWCRQGWAKAEQAALEKKL